jgi:hypothetical protein
VLRGVGLETGPRLLSRKSPPHVTTTVLWALGHFISTLLSDRLPEVVASVCCLLSIIALL